VTISATVQGETTLDAQGRAALQCKSPFAPGIHGRAKVFWIVDITSAAAAQTVRGGTVANVQFVPQILGVALQSGAPRRLLLQVRSLDVADRPARGLVAKAEIFLVEAKTVKERLAPGIHRYRNTPLFHKVSEHNVVTPADVSIPVKTGGRYVARVTAPQQPRTPPVSAEVTLEELEEETPVSVDNESSLQVTSERKQYRVGEDVVLTVQSPITGIATVSVQSDRIHHSELVELKGNAQSITIRALPSFAPNAWVCVHVIKPAPADSLPAERFGSCEIKVDGPNQRLEVTPVLTSNVLEPGSKASGVIKVTSEGRPVAGADVLAFAVDEAVLALGRWQLPDFFQTFFPRRGWKIGTSTALGGLWMPEKPPKLTHSQKGFILGDAGPVVANVTFRKDFKTLAFWKANMRSNANGEVPFEFTAPEGLTSYRVVAVAQNGADQFGHGHAVLRLKKPLQIEPVLPAFLRNDDKVTLLTAVRQDHAESDEIDVAVTVDAGIVLAEPAAKRVKAKRGEPVMVGFRAKAAPDAARAKVGFAAKSVSRPKIKDGEDNSFAVHPPTIERHETLSGTFAPLKPLNIAATTPPRWLQAKGRCDVILSGSPFLPKLAGLPALLDAQGSTEKLASRILAGTLLAEALEYFPPEGDTERQLRTKVNDALKRFAQTTIPDGGMPAWPGADKANEKRNDFVTIEAAWAIRNAARWKFDVDGKLLQRAKAWLSSIIYEDIEFGEVSPSMRCFALMAYGSSLGEEEREAKVAESLLRELEAEAAKNAAEDLFHARDELKLTVEDRAWLALAMHYLDILPQERETLLRELEKPIQESAFDPMTWSSKARAEALCLLARSEIESTNWSKATRQQVLKAFDKITQSSVDLSTHENLWLLLLFNSLTRGDIPPAMDKLSPKPPALSRNKISAGWLRVPLSKVPETFAQPVQSKVPGSYIIRASYQVPGGGAPTSDTHFKLERTFRNLTDASRTGLPETPWRPGDQILVTYNLDVDRAHSHLELEDQLPAGLETVNPKMQALAEHYQLPIEAGVNALQLSHVELRFARTVLYFEKAAPGRNVYSVLEHR
jgi:alpha-2-macroglobulin